MKATIFPRKPSRGFFRLQQPFYSLARRAVWALLKKLVYGRLTIVEKQQRRQFGGRCDRVALNGIVTVHHPRFYSAVFWGGSIGAAEAYMAGCWSADDLTKVIRILTINLQAMTDIDRGTARLSEPLHKWVHWIRKNTLSGSRQNVLAHYDLGNAFYGLFLDETMTYSCGIFSHPQSTLEEASEAKYRRICDKLQLTPGDRVLEIGTGWGGFAVYAAGRYGVHVTTTTISDAQYDYAENRIRSAGLQNRITLLKKDYRQLSGKYDKLVSIEMIEAVGHQYVTPFFRACSRLLQDDGAMALQAIVIGDQIFERYKRSVDFIKRYIFPGGCLTAVSAMVAAAARATDMRPVHLEDITPHYVRTLQVWRQRFFANIDGVRQLGFSDAFIRMWEYYLCYCEAGFAERYIGDVQMMFHKPRCRQPVLPIGPAVSGTPP